MDRTYRGLFAGIISAIIMNSLNLILFYIFNLTEIRFIDWTSLVMLGRIPDSTFEIIYILIIQILWTGSLGIFFCLSTPYSGSQGHILKGGLYAFLLTFIFRSIAILYQIAPLNDISATTSLINVTSAFLWGIILAAILDRLEQKKE
ncbi:hypothetical protein MWH28_11650 [Natroniella sulfidigena]|uniref:hypothetical protein n=1 Tax=Natroniella sulfidigena TaxID=723921 RepID=UPI00200B116E|nr:hypothetical protein [Natroniella sulfidigena]MCK8818011.1 hypothetical protein [Natroniella sulfidigena]